MRAKLMGGIADGMELEVNEPPPVAIKVPIRPVVEAIERDRPLIPEQVTYYRMREPHWQSGLAVYRQT